MVRVEIDSNAIMVAPMKSQYNTEMEQAHKSMMNQLHRVGIVPKKYVLDNEFPRA